MVRYSLLFWLPLYLASYLQMSPSHAGYISTRFELYGIGGVLLAAYLSDYVFHARRFLVAMMMMLMLACGCAAASLLHVGSAPWLPTAIVALLGCALFGADTILLGAATQDAAGTEQIGTVAGFVDGAGSIGQLIAPLLIAFVSENFGWPTVFRYLAVIALLCAVLLGWGTRLERRMESV